MVSSGLTVPQITEAAQLNEGTGVTAYASGLQNAPDTTLMSVIKGIDAGIALYKNANEAFDIDGSQAAAAEAQALQQQIQNDQAIANTARVKQQTEIEAIEAKRIANQEVLKANFQEALIRTQTGDAQADANMVSLALQAGSILDPQEAQMIQSTALRATNNPSAINQLSRGLKSTATRAERDQEALAKNTIVDAATLLGLDKNQIGALKGYEIRDGEEGKKKLVGAALDGGVLKEVPITTAQAVTIGRGLEIANANMPGYLENAGFGNLQERGQKFLGEKVDRYNSLRAGAERSMENLKLAGGDWETSDLKKQYLQEIEALSGSIGKLSGTYLPVDLISTPANVNQKSVEEVKSIATGASTDEVTMALGAISSKTEKEVIIRVGNESKPVITYYAQLEKLGKTEKEYPMWVHQDWVAKQLKELADKQKRKKDRVSDVQSGDMPRYIAN